MPMDAPQGSSFPPAAARRLRPEVLAAVASLAWFAVLVGWGLAAAEGQGPLASVTGLAAAVMPLVLIWGAAIMLRAMTDLRAEAQGLRAALDEMRAAAAPAVASPRPEPLATVRPADNAPATFTTRRDTTPMADRRTALPLARPAPAEDQPALALGTPAEDLHAPLAVADFVCALQFPESPDDKDGFRALRLALEDRAVAKLIRAAQDVLTLLSQEGIYMDDLRPDRARPELWRSFAQGERGRAISGLGGIRDRSSLALASGRMREDPIFRDAAHHFLRTFDRTFSAFEKSATDAELVDLADTRTARAFMLIGRVAGVFD